MEKHKTEKYWKTKIKISIFREKLILNVENVLVARKIVWGFSHNGWSCAIKCCGENFELFRSCCKSVFKGNFPVQLLLQRRIRREVLLNFFCVWAYDLNSSNLALCFLAWLSQRFDVPRLTPLSACHHVLFALLAWSISEQDDSLQCKLTFLSVRLKCRWED